MLTTGKILVTKKKILTRKKSYNRKIFRNREKFVTVEIKFLQLGKNSHSNRKFLITRKKKPLAVQKCLQQKNSANKKLLTTVDKFSQQ